MSRWVLRLERGDTVRQVIDFFTHPAQVMQCALRCAVVVGLLVGLWGGLWSGGAMEAWAQDQGKTQEANSGAPTYTLALQDVPLDRALQVFIERTRADIAYATEMTEGRTVYCRIRRATQEDLLRCLLDGTGIDYLRTSGGTYLLVEGVRGPDAAGNLQGTVVDARTGEPLPAANVLLADASTGTSTNDAGRFTFASVLAGRHRLVVTYVGYATAVDTIRVPTDGRQSVRIALEPSVLKSDPVVVNGLQQRLPSASLGRTETSAGSEDVLGVPASGAGAFGGLQNATRQTGVSTAHPRADLHVQGGGDGENVTLLDGVPIREPVTLGGLTSAFSSTALDRLVVHKTGYEAAHGSYTSGIVETTHDVRTARSAPTAPSLSISADPVSVSGRADVGWTGAAERRGGAMVAARRSVWEAYRAPSLAHLVDAWTRLDPTLTAWWVNPSAPGGTLLAQQPQSHVQFADLHAAVRHPLSAFQEVSASAYHGTNRLRTTVGSLLDSGPPGGGQRILASEGRNEWENTAAQVRYDWIAGGRATGGVQLYASRNDTRTFFGLRDSLLLQPADAEPDLSAFGRLGGSFSTAGADHSAEGNRLDEAGVQVDVDVSLSPRYHLQAGVAPQVFRGTFHVRNRFLGALGHEVRAWQVGSYAQTVASLGIGTTVTAGTRLTYVPARRTVYAEPRASLRFDRSETTVGDLALRVAGGLYRQYVVQSEISSAGPTAVVPSVQFWLPLDGTVAPPRAYHAAGDVLVRPSPAWILRLETYAKWHPRVLTVDYAGLVRTDALDDARLAATQTGRQSDLLAAGEGRAVGAALRVQRDGARISGDVTAEISRVHRRYPGRFGNRFVPAPWETPLQLAANLDVRVAGGVHLLGSWRGAWNRPWALRRAYYDYVALTGTEVSGFDLQRPGSQRLAPMSQVDLGVRAETTIRGVTLETRVHVANVLDRRNPFDWSLASGGDASSLTAVPRTLPGRRFSLHLGIHLGGRR